MIGLPTSIKLLWDRSKLCSKQITLILVFYFTDVFDLGLFDGLNFDRVLPNFVIQGGCPQGTGTGGPGYHIDCEINDNKHQAGTLSMAHAGRNTGGSQFFICHSPQPHLDGMHTVFGHTANMDVVNSIEQGDKIISVSIDQAE